MVLIFIGLCCPNNTYPGVHCCFFVVELQRSSSFPKFREDLSVQVLQDVSSGLIKDNLQHWVIVSVSKAGIFVRIRVERPHVRKCLWQETSRLLRCHHDRPMVSVVEFQLADLSFEASFG